MARKLLIELLLAGVLSGIPVAWADTPFIKGSEHVVWGFETGA